MSELMLDLVAYAIVAACAVLAWRKLRPRKARAEGDACGGCSGCGDDKACASEALSPPPADPSSR
ncbi:FeoB-associated Cys-rich membrane protein [Rivibacter subsaxonicus]|uniref:FeoB-associated Cys-rich membrane protein n=1 Tax=Rivibacter subsaxonicus TaxID=457575 RepID=UPI001A9104A9|nr:FeoB-associated Cys-rich membrane protein [Rivibacter subsaxonicus]